MSNFKKMRLVNEGQNKSDIFKIAQHDIPVNLKRVSDLDTEINTILSSDIDEENKAKLYSQTLRKYLTFKRLHQDQKVAQRNKTLNFLQRHMQIPKRTVQIPINTTPKRSRIPRVIHKSPRKTKTSIRKTPKKIKKLKKSFFIDEPSTSGYQNPILNLDDITKQVRNETDIQREYLRKLRNMKLPDSSKPLKSILKKPQSKPRTSFPDLSQHSTDTSSDDNKTSWLEF